MSRWACLWASVVMMSAWCLACPAATSQPAAPDPPAVDKALRTVRQLFRNEYVKTARADRVALARTMLEQAQQTRDDQAGRYALLREARDVAATAGEVGLAMRAIDELSRSFGGEPAEMKSVALGQALRAADTPALLETVVQGALACAMSSAMNEDFDRAGGFVTTALQAAQRTKRVGLLTMVQDRQKEIAAIQQESEQAKTAAGMLAKNPDDGAAKLAVGRQLCFVRGEWERGLTMLSTSSDAQLRTLAGRELAGSVDAGELHQLGDSWWEFGEKQPGFVRRATQSRAAAAYRKALPKLSGLSRQVAEMRIAEYEAVRMREMNLSPGLLAELFGDMTFGRKVLDRVDGQIDFDWGLGAAAEGMPKDNFSIRWTGLIKAPAKGKYTLIIHANSGARIFLGEKKVIDAEDIYRKRNGVRAIVELSDAPQPFKLEFWDGGGEANVKLQWIAPGSNKEETVPASAFWHDVLSR